jgi:ADP-ribose pyrophosphatase YjhB (NUDIX family)
MITFEEGGKRFNYRVVGIALDVDRVLLLRTEKDDFWFLPGGRVELLEPSQDALIREMREELEVDVRVERLVWVVENFFEYEGKSYHELALYFLMSFLPDSHLNEKSEAFVGNEDGLKLIFKWHPLGKLEEIPLYPTFLRERLNSIHQITEHIVHTDSQETSP